MALRQHATSASGVAFSQSTNLVSSLHCAQNHDNVAQVVWTDICQGLMVSSLAESFLQPPSDAVD